ncbi:TfoX/Sxy family protein [Xanthobacter autotrophicus]|uniref:TfoX/Sxy family protein n=1 Tax=Xanthobacter TaxID=279 RepID=UPI0024AA83D1|nr:TfoX/Sxy family protein [Xanthobacter autotrophicus]MDI4664609.1 TfoX/Sxy family protein [Xanthobacter autotrophicus]
MDEDTIADLFSAFGDVRTRRMFGGRGLYADGLMFAIEVRGTIYLKADADLAAVLEGRGSAPFSYLANGAVRTMAGFWSVPEAALDDGDDLAMLARHSLALARAAAARKPLKTAGARSKPKSPSKKKTPRG